VEGILWDRIELVHVPFVQDVETNWENGAHFMVPVGQCKKMALDDYFGSNPSLTEEKQIESFWYALFGGDYPRIREGVDMDCKQWLPPISKDWDLRQPRITALSSGLLQVSIFSAMAAEVLGENSVFPGQGMQFDMTPKDWGPEERQYYMERFNELGNLWQNQPFDLYHRPFMLPNVVLDPYVHRRVPKGFTKEQRDQRPSLPEFLPRATCYKPPEYATSGLEKCALGRSFL
jgi:hypothetical protein